MTKAEAIIERLNVGTPTAHLRAKGRRIVSHYLDPRRRPARGTGWSERYRDDRHRQRAAVVAAEGEEARFPLAERQVVGDAGGDDARQLADGRDEPAKLAKLLRH